jgi:sn-glycerol 3-phosphate transport system ATP-binding protein/multiple sugar transport system ATP-binding protein
MREEIALLQRRIGKAMLYVTHDQTEAMTLADRIVIMRDGRVQQIGSPLEVYDRPANAFVAGFIGSPEMNLVEASIRDGQLELAAGVCVPVPSVEGARDVIAGVRPEAVEIVGEGLSYTVSGIEQLGSQTLFIGTTAGHRLRVMAGRRDDIGIGETIKIAIPGQSVHLFDRGSGERL